MAGFVLTGALFGGIFPVAASVMACLLRQMWVTPRSLLVVQTSEPLLWIIDTAPIVCATAGLLVGLERYSLSRALTRNRLINQELRQATSVKTDFLAKISHELRTPMNGIIGMVELTLESRLTREQRLQLGMAQESASRLLQVINDLLDFVSLDEGDDSARAAPFHLREWVSETTALLGERARKRKLALHENIDPAIPDGLVGDPIRLRQILLNLLDNALKFTETGRVDLSVTTAYLSDSKVEIRFSVSDTGKGIAEEERQRIFDAFHQSEEYLTRSHEGCGLGLAIASSLVRSMGGEIGVESLVGRGSTFHFTLAFGLDHSACLIEETGATGFVGTTAEVEPTAVGASGKEALEILLVEDNLVNQKIASRMLTRWGHAVHTASNGKLAVEIFESVPLDLVLMDVQMPVMDGLEATRKIRKIEAIRGGAIPILALTAHTSEEDRRRCLTSGMDDILAKPIDQKKLESALRRLQELTTGCGLRPGS